MTVSKRWFLIYCLFILLIPAISLAYTNGPCPAAGTSTALCNPLASKSITTFPQVIYEMLNLMSGLIIGLSIVYILFAGFRMVVSQGNTEEVEKSKAGLQWTILGFILGIMSYVIIAATGNYIGVKDVDPNLGTSVQNPITSGTFAVFITKMITGLFEVLGVVAVLMIIISGFKYITAQGNEEQTEQAKSGLQWAIIGLALALLAYVIVVATAKLFGG